MRGGSSDYSILTTRGSNHVLHLLEGEGEVERLEGSVISQESAVLKKI